MKLLYTTYFPETKYHWSRYSIEYNAEYYMLYIVPNELQKLILTTKFSAFPEVIE